MNTVKVQSVVFGIDDMANKRLYLSDRIEPAEHHHPRYDMTVVVRRAEEGLMRG